MVIARMRTTALILITALIVLAAVTSFAESYRALVIWAHEHGLSGVWAAAFPLQLDVFIAVGELALFVALAERWPARSRIGAWAVVGAGLAVSVAGNVGHVLAHSAADRATAAVPPMAAAAALAVGMGVLKRVVAAHHETPEVTHLAPADVPAGQPTRSPLQGRARRVDRDRQPAGPASGHGALWAQPCS